MIHKRFNGAEWYNTVQKLPVNVIGIGGIGSWLSLFLSRIGCEIYTFDFDVIDSGNIGGQFFGTSSIRKTKEEAIKSLLIEFSDNEVNCEGKYIETSLGNTIVFACADDMDVRALAFNKWKEEVKKWNYSTPIVPLFIDGRMTMEYSEIYAVIPGREEAYEKTLFKNSEAADLICNMKATSHVGAHTACIMTEIFLNHITNCTVQEDVREVPFKVKNETYLILTDVSR